MEKYKVLKHKQLVHTYGAFLQDFKDTIVWSNVPVLLPPDTTMDSLYKKSHHYPTASWLLKDYELVDVDIIFIN